MPSPSTVNIPSVGETLLLAEPSEAFSANVSVSLVLTQRLDFQQLTGLQASSLHSLSTPIFMSVKMSFRGTNVGETIHT